jgi:hypothetical protein
MTNRKKPTKKEPDTKKVVCITCPYRQEYLEIVDTVLKSLQHFPVK